MPHFLAIRVFHKLLLFTILVENRRRLKKRGGGGGGEGKFFQVSYLSVQKIPSKGQRFSLPLLNFWVGTHTPNAPISAAKTA